MGDKIVFKSGNSDMIDVKIVGTRRYDNLDSVLGGEDVSKLVPDMPKEEILKNAQKFFSEADIEKYGLFVFEFEKVQRK